MAISIQRLGYFDRQTKRDWNWTETEMNNKEIQDLKSHQLMLYREFTKHVFMLHARNLLISKVYIVKLNILSLLNAYSFETPLPIKQTRPNNPPPIKKKPKKTIHIYYWLLGYHLVASYLGVNIYIHLSHPHF